MADYRKMWEELGMNVELHDQLCAVLPQAFGDVFLSQENRPDSMDYYNMVVADIHGIRPAELIEHQKKGGKVFGTFCVYVPDEIVFAADAIATGLCGGSQFWVPGGEKVLPANTFATPALGRFQHIRFTKNAHVRYGECTSRLGRAR